MRRLAPALAAVLLGLAPAGAETAAPLKGALASPALWANYKRAFVSPGGRVIDNANGDVSHSEGQGYGMLLAVAADDPATFARLWDWTRSQLMLRPDGLAAWRWQPDATPHVTDRNNAADGDVLIAWALLEAGEAWNSPAYGTAALRMVRALAARDVVDTALGPALLPGATGFGAGERPDGPVVNPSYWVFPALARFAALAPERGFDAVAATGLRLLEAARFGPARLPSDWVSLAGPAPAPAKGFPQTFGYDAIRVPLYLAWGGRGTAEALAPFEAAFASGPHVVEVATGRALAPLDDGGYRAVAALTRCALHGTALPPETGEPTVDRYYPTTLRALVLVAAHRSFPACL